MLRPVAVVLQVSLHTIAPRPHQTRTGAHMATEAAIASDDPAAESKQVECPRQLGVTDDDETSSAKSFLLQLNLGNECREMDCLTGDGDGDAAPSASATAEGAPPRKPAKAKAKSKSKSKSKICPLCGVATDDYGKRPVCRLCNNDWEASERDAKAQGEHAYWKELTKDYATMRTFLAAWKSHCGASRGPGHKRGGFKFVEFKQERTRKHSSFKGQEKLMLTEREFIEHFEKKGMARTW